jgi:hypothetical protein
LSRLFPKQIYTTAAKYLASTELAIALFGAICLASIPGTFIESRAIYSNPLFLSLLGMLALNLLCCTLRRWKALAKSTLILHGGVLLTLAGCVVTSFGYVATVNIYEGSSVNQAYRWDRKQDAPLGMELAVKRINREYFPVPVRVGVLRGKEKFGLYTLQTGESFNLGDYRVAAAAFEPAALNLKLTVYKQGRVIGTADTEGASNLPADFPYAFKLVSYKDPSVKRVWVDLVLSEKDKTLAAGTAEVNGPFSWQGLYFYNTLTGKDENGRPYAGMQIVRDPGRPYVFCGFAVLVLGAILAFFRRFYGYK